MSVWLECQSQFTFQVEMVKLTLSLLLQKTEQILGFLEQFRHG